MACVMASCYGMPVMAGVMAHLYGWCYGLVLWHTCTAGVMAYLYGWCYGLVLWHTCMAGVMAHLYCLCYGLPA